MITLIWESSRLAVDEVFLFCFLQIFFTITYFSSSYFKNYIHVLYVFGICLYRSFSVDLCTPPRAPHTHMPCFIYFFNGTI